MDGNKNEVSLGRSLCSVRFLLSVVVLVLAATVLQPVVKALSKKYTKKSIAIRRPLKQFDMSALASFGTGWEFMREKGSVDLGTDECVVIKLKKTGTDKVFRTALFVTYYSDPADKVPHTPDVCYRQDGAVVKKMTKLMIDTAELAPEYPEISACLLIFQMSHYDQVVIFSFCVEGEFRHDREQVRWAIGKPGNKYTYFSKIEVTSSYTTGGDPTEAIDRCTKLFREAVLVLVRDHFPEKERLTGDLGHL